MVYYTYGVNTIMPCQIYVQIKCQKLPVCQNSVSRWRSLEGNLIPRGRPTHYLSWNKLRPGFA